MGKYLPASNTHTKNIYFYWSGDFYYILPTIIYDYNFYQLHTFKMYHSTHTM